MGRCLGSCTGAACRAPTLVDHSHLYIQDLHLVAVGIDNQVGAPTIVHSVTFHLDGWLICRETCCACGALSVFGMGRQGSKRRDRGHLRAGPVLQGPLAASWAATAAATAAGAATIPRPSQHRTTVERPASVERPVAVASAVGPAPKVTVPLAPHPAPLTPWAAAPPQPAAEAAAHFQRQLTAEAGPKHVQPEAMQAESVTETGRPETAAAAPTVSDEDGAAGTAVAAPTGTGGVLPNDGAGRRRSRAAAARRGLPHACGFRRASRSTGSHSVA